MNGKEGTNARFKNKREPKIWYNEVKEVSDSMAFESIKDVINLNLYERVSHAGLWEAGCGSLCSTARSY